MVSSAWNIKSSLPSSALGPARQKGARFLWALVHGTPFAHLGSERKQTLESASYRREHDSFAQSKRFQTMLTIRKKSLQLAVTLGILLGARLAWAQEGNGLPQGVEVLAR